MYRAPSSHLTMYLSIKSECIPLHGKSTSSTFFYHSLLASWLDSCVELCGLPTTTVHPLSRVSFISKPPRTLPVLYAGLWLQLVVSRLHDYYIFISFAKPKELLSLLVFSTQLFFLFACSIMQKKWNDGAKSNDMNYRKIAEKKGEKNLCGGWCGMIEKTNCKIIFQFNIGCWTWMGRTVEIRIQIQIQMNNIWSFNDTCQLEETIEKKNRKNCDEIFSSLFHWWRRICKFVGEIPENNWLVDCFVKFVSEFLTLCEFVLFLSSSLTIIWIVIFKINKKKMYAL